MQPVAERKKKKRKLKYHTKYDRKSHIQKLNAMSIKMIIRFNVRRYSANIFGMLIDINVHEMCLFPYGATQNTHTQSLDYVRSQFII